MPSTLRNVNILEFDCENYAAVEPTLLTAIDFLTNGTVNCIISDDDRINCNILALSYSLNLGQIPFIFLYSISIPNVLVYNLLKSIQK
jgi:hypothetical protein